MTQPLNHPLIFHSAIPVAESTVSHPRRLEDVISTPPAQPGVIAWLVARIRNYLAVRRTLRALDELSWEQLKDIGYRRVPGERPRYERLP
jgi:uncharacterized protein YjiS (DUF1127 family)